MDMICQAGHICPANCGSFVELHPTEQSHSAQINGHYFNLGPTLPRTQEFAVKVADPSPIEAKNSENGRFLGRFRLHE